MTVLTRWLDSRHKAARYVELWPSHRPVQSGVTEDRFLARPDHGNGQGHGETLTEKPDGTSRKRCDIGHGCRTDDSPRWYESVAGTWCDECWNKNEERLARKFPKPGGWYVICDGCLEFTVHPPDDEGIYWCGITWCERCF